MKASDRRKQWVREGRCWHCGEPSGGFYMCVVHRERASLCRIVHRAVEIGVLTKDGSGSSARYSPGNAILADVDTRWGRTSWGMSADRLLGIVSKSRLPMTLTQIVREASK